MSSSTPTPTSGLLALPQDILVMLPAYLHDIEDFLNVSATCRALRSCMETAHAHTILQLAWASRRVFFRPSPHVLVCATARALGDWARESPAHEAQLAAGLPRGLAHLADLALAQRRVGLTLARVRELHELRFSIVNPVADVVDACVGARWYRTPQFWSGGVDDAYTICADAPEALFRLAIYGELFGPDFDAFLDPPDPASSLPLSSGRRTLSVETRLEFVKYCIPDFATECYQEAIDTILADGSPDPRRAVVVHPKGPYYRSEDGAESNRYNHNLALMWLMKSSRWRPLWQKARQGAGAGHDFNRKKLLPWCEEDDNDNDWRQICLETVMQCQGLEGFGMIRPETADRWKPKIREWRKKIALMAEPPRTTVGQWDTHAYPDLWGDLRICTSGYVSGT
ncbi:hypothetical protein F4819DRAFT_446215 [Hypoxylon fuscum]|nr:hypothetical protein F4819DRAFT_446215 [Hypoxylon fuscum]